MNARYIPLREPPRQWFSDQEFPQSLPSCVVHEQDAAPVDTGLVDAYGTRLFRITDRPPIGFRSAR